MCIYIASDNCGIMVFDLFSRLMQSAVSDNNNKIETTTLPNDKPD